MQRLGRSDHQQQQVQAAVAPAGRSPTARSSGGSGGMRADHLLNFQSARPAVEGGGGRSGGRCGGRGGGPPRRLPQKPAAYDRNKFLQVRWRDIDCLARPPLSRVLDQQSAMEGTVRRTIP